MSVRADRRRGARAQRYRERICVTCYGLVVYRVSDIQEREKSGLLFYSLLSARARFFSTFTYVRSRGRGRRERGYRDLCVVPRNL